MQQIADRIIFTRYSGDAIEIASQAHAYDGIASVGGDGTLFEILKGINLKAQRLAVIPAGRGNSLARDLGLMRVRELLDVLHWEEARSIDLMEVNVTTADGKESRHLSASTIAVGYPAAVALRARQISWMGKMSYATAAAIMKPGHFITNVQYEKGAARKLQLSGFIANNTRHLANFLAFHDANYSDGHFDIMEICAGRVKQTMHNLSALSGTRAYEPYPSIQARSAQLRLEKPQDLMIDGEIIPHVISLDIKILPSALACNGALAR